MNAPIELPKPVPRLSRKLLWITLGVPPALTLLAMMLIPLLGFRPQAMFEAMMVVIFLILLGIIPGLSFHFHDAIKIRYRGSSLGFLVFSYIFGQIIVCAVLAVGSCLLISFQYKI
jgi:hypothetical protein